LSIQKRCGETGTSNDFQELAEHAGGQVLAAFNIFRSSGAFAHAVIVQHSSRLHLS
jgi:hypothetical protein